MLLTWGFKILDRLIGGDFETCLLGCDAFCDFGDAFCDFGNAFCDVSDAFCGFNADDMGAEFETCGGSLNRP